MVDIHLARAKFHTVGATVVELASLVSLGNVDFGEVADTSDLDILGCLDEMDTLERAVGHGACTTTRLRAVCDRIALDFTNGSTTS